MRYLVILAAAAPLLAGSLQAQDSSTKRDSVQTLRAVNVTAEVEDRSAVKPIQQLTLPVTVSITQRRAEETVNLVDAEDAVKYLPSVFLRKRNNGDTQATLATRVWGTSSSARSLIFADGVPLTALIANNNTVGGPRWGLVAPAGDRAHRHDDGPVLRRVRRQLDGRRHGDHHAAAATSSRGQIQQTQALQTLRPVRHARNLHDVADRRERRRPVRQVRRSGRAATTRRATASRSATSRARRSRPAPPAAFPRRTSSTPRRTCSARAAC